MLFNRVVFPIPLAPERTTFSPRCMVRFKGRDNGCLLYTSIELRFKLEDELIRLWQMTGTTVLFITHNIEEAVYLGEHIMILTNKPTTVKQTLENHLPRPRDIAAPEFVQLREQVTELIKWW